MDALRYTVIYLFPAAMLLALRFGGLTTWLVPLLAFGVVPALDWILGQDAASPSPDEEARREANPLYSLWLWAWVPAQLAVFLLAARVFAAGHLSWAESLGWILSTGITSGAVGITVAHELGHRFDPWQRALSLALLVQVGYGHWRLEHIAGHHRHVATPGDPASARLGQSVYAFWWQTVVGTFRHAWRLGQEQAQRKKRAHPWMNEVVGALLAELLLLAGIFAWLGVRGGLFTLGQAVVAFTLLELVNYVEHYGLSRRIQADGRPEKVTPLHSWNNSNRLTNWFLINLQRHSDHHANPRRPYPILRHMAESPQLPTGYAGMLLLSLFPALWRRVMDPRARPFQPADQRSS